VSVRWNTKRVVEAISRKAGRGGDNAFVEGLDAVRQAEATASGNKVTVDMADGALRRSEASVVTSSGGQAPASVRVMGLLERMRQIAMRGATREVSGRDRTVMSKELERLSTEIDEISADISRSVPRGEIPANYDSVEAFFESVFADETLDGLLDPFSSYSLGVDAKSIAVSTPGSSRRALDVIDDALEEMQVIHSNGASTEAHLDAALERLAAFVDTIDPNAVVPGDPDAAVEAAEIVRLYLMSGRGLSAIGQTKNLQQSVTALLQ